MHRHVSKISGFKLPCTPVLSENPIESLWHEILKLSDPYLLQRSMSPNWQNGTLTDDIIHFITTSIRQSFEYYEVSKNASLEIKPLLVYYSILNLSKAALYIKNEISPPEYHGLKQSNYEPDLFDCTEKVGNGVFLEISKAFGANWIQPNTTFKFSDFLIQNIELSAPTANTYGDTPKILCIELIIKTNGTLYFELNPNIQTNIPNFRGLLNQYPDFSSKFTESTEGLNIRFTAKYNSNNLDDARNILSKYFHMGLYNSSKSYGWLYLVDQDKIIPQASCYFALMHMLSEIVRYKPTKLFNLMHSTSISYEWFIKDICQKAIRVYPNHILNMINGEQTYYVFESYPN